MSTTGEDSLVKLFFNSFWKGKKSTASCAARHIFERENEKGREVKELEEILPSGKVYEGSSLSK